MIVTARPSARPALPAGVPQGAAGVCLTACSSLGSYGAAPFLTGLCLHCTSFRPRLNIAMLVSGQSRRKGSQMAYCSPEQVGKSEQV